MKNLTTRRFIGVDGYSYSSINNFKIISNFLNDIKIYQKYFRIIRIVRHHIRKYKIKYSNNVMKMYERFNIHIERFIMKNFGTIDLSLNYDVFKRLISDIYFRFKLA